MTDRRNERENDDLQPKVKTERPDPKVADERTKGGVDRPGFDLGGSSEENREGGPKTTVPGAPGEGPVPGGAGDRGSRR